MTSPFSFCPFASATLALAALGLTAVAQGAEAVTLTRQADRVRIEVGGQFFSDYIFTGAAAPTKPYLYPVLAADGTRLNREYPMADIPGEEHDHPHHRSLWFCHGEVNGQNFWAEGKDCGKIVHDALLEVKSGPAGVIRARDRWVGNDGKLVCTDETTLRVQAAPEGRMLDYEVTVFAPKDSAVTFADTKEGSMAMRVAQWMTMTHKSGRNEVPGEGHAVNSAGDRDAKCWGKRAEWADYYAPHAGKVYGVALFDHPQNPRHPTWWHLRDYGLYAANPFGRHDFENLKDQPKAGEFVIPAGGKATFRYRFYIHMGDTAAAQVAEEYRKYSAGQ